MKLKQVQIGTLKVGDKLRLTELSTRRGSPWYIITAITFDGNVRAQTRTIPIHGLDSHPDRLVWIKEKP